MINIMIDIDKIRNTNVFQNLYIQSYFCFVLIFMNHFFINASPPSLSFFLIVCGNSVIDILG